MDKLQDEKALSQFQGYGYAKLGWSVVDLAQGMNLTTEEFSRLRGDIEFNLNSEDFETLERFMDGDPEHDCVECLKTCDCGNDESQCNMCSGCRDEEAED